MSAPGCTVVSRTSLTDEQVRDLPALLAPFGTVSIDEDGWFVVVGNAKEFGGEEPEAEVEVGICIATPEQAFNSLKPESLRRAGVEPGRVLNISGANGNLYHHVFVGRVACHLAERLEAWVLLGEICCLGDRDGNPELSQESKDRIDQVRGSLAPDDRDNPDAMFKLFVNQDERLNPVSDEILSWYDRKVREKALKMPGRFIELPDPTGNCTYLVDATYMKAWLQDPDFSID